MMIKHSNLFYIKTLCSALHTACCVSKCSVCTSEYRISQTALINFNSWGRAAHKLPLETRRVTPLSLSPHGPALIRTLYDWLVAYVFHIKRGCQFSEIANLRNISNKQATLSFWDPVHLKFGLFQIKLRTENGKSAKFSYQGTGRKETFKHITNRKGRFWSHAFI